MRYGHQKEYFIAYYPIMAKSAVDSNSNYFFLIIGIPLLEENEIENEGSNSSDPGDTVSATGSEGSSK